jgi:hypothetical protein
MGVAYMDAQAACSPCRRQHVCVRRGCSVLRCSTAYGCSPSVVLCAGACLHHVVSVTAGGSVILPGSRLLQAGGIIRLCWCFVVTRGVDSA